MNTLSVAKGRFGYTNMQQWSKGSPAFERRAKQRIYGSYPAIVQGKDASGKRIRSNATLINISATGLCLILKPHFHVGDDLFVLFRYSVTGRLGKGQAPLIAIRGNAIRSSTTSQGMQSVAVKIRHSRFL